MAKKDRFPPGYSASFAPHCESEGSGSSGRIDSTEDSSAPMRKLIDLNSASRDGFAVPIQIIPLSKLSSSERKSLVIRLTSELEQTRLLQKRAELLKKKPVNAVESSNNILSWNNAQQRGLQVGNTKKSSGLGSGPGRKGRGWNRSITGRFQSGEQNMPVNADAGLLKQCESLLKKLMSQQYGWVFNTPVDVVKLNIPDYFDVIKNPMDLGTIKSKLTSGKYSSPLDFLADVRLTFANAKTYNPPGSDVHILANTMSQFFELRWKAIEKKLSVNNTSQSLPKRSGVLEETQITKPMVPSKKRKLSPAQREVIQEPSERKMRDEDKQKLSHELENFIGEMPDSVVNILREQSSNKGDGGEDEIEIDINDLGEDILFTLRKLLDDHFQEKQKDLTKSEACEIELPNVSGLSNSSLQVDKGNDPLDEDVDIGGNEAPVTSYPPVVIDKDDGGRAEECVEAGPDSDRGSEGSKGSSAVKQVQVGIDRIAYSNKKADDEELVDGHPSVSGFDQLEQGSQLKPYSSDSDGQMDGDSGQAERQDDKMDPEKLRREREELEKHKKREKARLQAEAKAAEDARKQAEAEAAAEAKRRREIEREAAREALLKMEKTVEINENSRFLEDLEMLRAQATEQLPSSVDETSPDHSQDGFGNFKFGGSNPLEQLGLYMKVDEEDEEGEPPSVPNGTQDVEEGEID
ncbi:hypothetical protein BUALT_Bualt04G0171300 [Buddleja alternifolia]|uniref:Transcription factor GTE8 n=1 Tax=Buddleja alternifolia TaxID=168488 RepID=A0AAV6XX15_9LAMI|nr:hypothetical protein BUALT_Bualt04G0171300 [Buddleja alternifolia]